MKLSALKQPGDLSLQSYVDGLIDAVNKFEDVTAVVIIARKPDQISTISNISDPSAVPDILSQFASVMRKEPRSHEKKSGLPTEDSN